MQRLHRDFQRVGRRGAIIPFVGTLEDLIENVAADDQAIAARSHGRQRGVQRGRIRFAWGQGPSVRGSTNQAVADIPHCVGGQIDRIRPGAQRREDCVGIAVRDSPRQIDRLANQAARRTGDLCDIQIGWWRLNNEQWLRRSRRIVKFGRVFKNITALADCCWVGENENVVRAGQSAW